MFYWDLLGLSEVIYNRESERKEMIFMLKKFISIILVSLILNLTVFTSFAAENKKVFTSEQLKEFIRTNHVYSNVYEKDLLHPLLSGDITFSKPFKIPFYSVETETAEVYQRFWATALFADNGTCAVALLSYFGDEIGIDELYYLSYDMTEQLKNGKELSLFFVEAELDYETNEDAGNLLFGIYADGRSNLLSEEVSPGDKITNKLKLNTDKNDYAVISEYNKISKGMKKAVTVDNAAFNKTVYKKSSVNKIKDKSIITMKNRTDIMYNYKGSEKFVVHEQGEDANGEMMYSLSPENDPKKQLVFAGSKKVYLRCAYGGTRPIYKICPVTNPKKALTLSNGKGKIRKWTGAENQQWYIIITK